MLSPGAQVFSPQLPGLATVLGNGLNPLRIIQQESYRQRQEQARAAKAKADLDAKLILPTFDTDGSTYFQPEVDAAVKQAMLDTQEKYRAARRGEISQSDALNFGKMKVAEVGGLTNKAKDAGTQIDQFVSTAKSRNLDEGKVRAGLAKVLATPDGAARMSAKDFRTELLSTFDNDANYYDEGSVVNGFLKNLAQKQESEHTTASRPGQSGMTFSAASNFFANDGKGKIVYTMDARGNRVPKIANIQALEQAALQDPQMAALLRRNLQNGQRPTASLLMGLGGEHVTDDQLEALNAQTDQNTPHERQALADLIRPYGTLVEKQRELSPMAVPRGRSGSGAKFAPNPVTSYEGGLTGADLPSTATPFSEFFKSPELATPSSQKGFHSFARRPQPTYATPTNPSKTYEFKALPASELIQAGSDGGLRVNKNNKQAIFGIPGEGVHIFRNSKTGEVKIPADSEAAAAKQFKDLGSDWSLEAAVQVAVPKNKNFARDSESIKARLLAREAAKAESTDGYVPKTPDQLEKEAFDLAAGGTEQSYLPYNKRTRGSIDAQTANAYAEYADKILPQTQHRLRASKAAAPARPEWLKSKTGSAPANRKQTTSPDKTGGMM